MKSERRHDLETNELVVWLDKFRPYTGQATAVVAVLVALLAIRSIWNSDLDARETAAWDAYAMAQDSNDPELMKVLEVADNNAYASTSMPEWANVTWADRQLLLAGRAYLADRNAALSRLEKVEGIYSTLAQGASDNEVQNRAQFGLARVYELQNKLDEAKKAYGKVQGDLLTVAAERAAQLDLPEVQEACAWLATAELPKRATAGSPSGRPGFGAALPATGSGEFDTKSLEELLGNLAIESKDKKDRYSEEAEGEEAEKSEAEGAEDSDTEAAENEEAAEETASEQPEAEAETPAEPAGEEQPAAEAADEQEAAEEPAAEAAEATEGQ